MASAFTFEIIRGSSVPTLQLTLKDADGNALDLTTASAVHLAVASSFETPQADLAIYKALTIVAPASAGVVKAEWLSSDTSDVPAALYQAEARVTWGADQIGKVGPFNFRVVAAVMA